MADEDERRPEGIRVDWDVPITMDDGVTLRADVFRPTAEGRYPVLITCGPYAKGLAFQDGYPSAWEKMVEEHPDVIDGSSGIYQNWEVADPEKWVPHGYVCVRVDSRGCGRSPGFIDHFSPRETKDYHDCIEWAADQPWSNGKIGITGISYYAMNQWLVASSQPPHLAAICVWEGASDWYRELARHGGILCTFAEHWYDMQIKTVQYGVGGGGPRSRVTGALVCGDETLPESELSANRIDYAGSLREHFLEDDHCRARMPDFAKITVPLLSAGNWGGQGLHLRGNVEGFLRSASEQKWLEIHGLEHWTHFYTDYGVSLQRRFFDHFLKGEDNGWDREPPLQLQIRHADGTFTRRRENAWPLPSTRWTRAYLDAGRSTLEPLQPPAQESVTFDALGEGVTFTMPAVAHDTEITGPLAARLFVESSTTDADLFLVVRAFGPDDSEVVFRGAIDPHTPVTQGWLRASHRKLDPELSTPHRPYLAHDEVQPLTAGVIHQLDIEIWPTSLVLPKGHRLALTVQGKDYEYPDAGVARLSNFKNDLRGSGPFLHDDPTDRPQDTFGGRTTLHTGGSRESFLLLPVVPDVSG
ncbi:CocE/NonD family hydrolase [Streptomyces sp. NPDC026672]|uniref:CocE/NonD family hydrolase n=1 Tax=unclassified Streptomyces TaxID=2593676 RepID=UPI0033FB71F8